MRRVTDWRAYRDVSRFNVPSVRYEALMETPKSKDPLHGVTLKQLLTELVDEFGWEELAAQVDIRCFRFDPSINSSLVFLRKTPWARTKVEEIYVRWKTSR